jgi:hypothetical protein
MRTVVLMVLTVVIIAGLHTGSFGIASPNTARIFCTYGLSVSCRLYLLEPYFANEPRLANSRKVL